DAVGRVDRVADTAASRRGIGRLVAVLLSVGGTGRPRPGRCVRAAAAGSAGGRRSGPHRVAQGERAAEARAGPAPRAGAARAAGGGGRAPPPRPGGGPRTPTP